MQNETLGTTINYPYKSGKSGLRKVPLSYLILGWELAKPLAYWMKENSHETTINPKADE